jgi:hypothetical protein
MFSIIKKFNGRITLRIATTLSAAVALAVIASGGWNAQASTLGQAQGQQASNVGSSPDATCPPDGQCFADVPSGNPFYAFVNRIYQQDLVSGYPCGGPGELCDPFNRPYYRPVNNVTRQQMAKFIDNARRLPQIYIETASPGTSIYVSNTVGIGVSGNSGDSIGVYGISNSPSNVGVWGESSFVGVYGTSTDGVGVRGNSNTETGVYGGTGGTGSNDAGVWGFGDAPAYAGRFDGNVQVTGNLSKGGGSFKIDDPLDPENKYLYHSFVESPDMMNVYNGNVTTDAKGEATIQLPAYFEVLNRDFRYQLTPIGQFAQAIVAEEVRDNHFTIRTDKPNVKVSWQVTGIRQDPYANAHRIPEEQDKPANEKGKYLHPTEWGQPASKGIDYEEQQQMQHALEHSTPGKP